ncbi:neo-calmodulin-like [Glandiceps talaboti]
MISVGLSNNDEITFNTNQGLFGIDIPILFPPKDKTAPEYIRTVFSQFDINGDGAITIAELKEGLRRGGIAYTDTEVYHFMRQVDLNGDGEIDFNEFSIYWVGKQQQVKFSEQTQNTFPTLAEMRAKFQELDGDGNGYLTMDEIKIGLIKIKGYYTDEEVYKILRSADEDGDGRIDFNEFVIMIAKMHAQGKPVLVFQKK